jgi:predicted nuclease of predicted toxin-antitoxin system
VSEVHRGAEDATVLELALSERRVLLTEDKDFGQLVFAAARDSGGVVLIRWPVSARHQHQIAGPIER